MLAQDPLYNSKPHSCSLEVVARMEALERGKDLFRMNRVESHSIVDNAYQVVLRGPFMLNDDPGLVVPSGEFQRIGQNILLHHLQHGCIVGDTARGRHPHIDLGSPIL